MDYEEQVAWWEVNSEIIVAYDYLRRTVDKLNDLKQDDCSGLYLVLQNFAIEALKLIEHQKDRERIKDEIDDLLRGLRPPPEEEL